MQYTHIRDFSNAERSLFLRLNLTRIPLPVRFARWPEYYPDSAIYLCELRRFVEKCEREAPRFTVSALIVRTLRAYHTRAFRRLLASIRS